MALPFDQLSTIIHRLEQIFEILNPAEMAVALEHAISAVTDPLPGDVDGLRRLAAGFSAAGRGASPVASQLQTMARKGLPDVWQSDAGVTASVVASDTSDLAGRAGPAFRAVAAAIDTYADTLSQLERHRHDLLDHLVSASNSGPHLHLFGVSIPLDPFAWSGWIDGVRNLLSGSIGMYNDLQNAADTLAAQFADAQSQATAGIAFGAGMDLTDAVVLSAVTVNGSSLLSPVQLTRLAQIMKTMSAADKATLEGTLRAAKSPLEEAYILKALAAGHSVSQTVTFAGEIRGQPDAWLIDHLSLASVPGNITFFGVPLVQRTQTECGSASIVAARALTDPIFAYSLTAVPKGVSWDATVFNRQAAAVDAQTHDATNTFWAQSLGTSPWGMASGMNAGAGGDAGYGVHWVDDTDPRESSAALEQAISAVDAGHPVPVLLGPTVGHLAHGTPMHYVLITGHSDGKLSIYNPENGIVRQVPDSDFRDGTMQSIDSQAPHVNAVIMPGG